MQQALKPCPFCGMDLGINDPDTVYPSGTAWYTDNDNKYYTFANEVPQTQWCYQVVCTTHYGGCGGAIVGDTKQEAINKWNTRCKN